MKDKKAKPTTNQVFSHPIRKLNVAQLENVLGGYSTGAQKPWKSTGGADNQGRNFS